MPDLDSELEAYETMRPDLENQHMGEWVIIHNRELVGVFSSLDEAASHAVRTLGRGPYLIRQVGAPPVTMPASVMYHPDYAKHEVRIR